MSGVGVRVPGKGYSDEGWSTRREGGLEFRGKGAGQTMRLKMIVGVPAVGVKYPPGLSRSSSVAVAFSFHNSF